MERLNTQKKKIGTLPVCLSLTLAKEWVMQFTFGLWRFLSSESLYLKFSGQKYKINLGLRYFLS